MLIPRILHQLWIGDASKAPTKFMATWRDAHVPLGFEYILWNEAEIERRRRDNPRFSASLSSLEHRIAEMEEINGKADILRWIILDEYGGVFCDADSICVSPIDDELLGVKEGAFAGYENERVRGAGWSPQYPDIYSHKHALIALGCVGFPPQHPLVKAAVEWMRVNSVSVRAVGQRAWFSVGPGLITRLYYSEPDKYRDALRVFPSYYFLPMHYSGVNYYGHGKVYAYQEWGSTKRSYETMNENELPQELRNPPTTDTHTILMPSYNAKAIHLRECLESIKGQQGHFWIDVVCVDDGSDALHKSILKRMLDGLVASSRWIRVYQYENETNKGITNTLARGLAECPEGNELVFRMDTDDIMHPTRMERQIRYMRENPDAMLCGTQVHLFDTNTGRITGTTRHPGVVSWCEYLRRPSHWMANHPTYCFRRREVVDVGGYNTNIHSVCEDFDLLLRVMKRYGSIHNLPEALLHYRLHDAQITKQLRVSGAAGADAKSATDWTSVRNAIIEHYSREDSLFFHEATKSLQTP